MKYSLDTQRGYIALMSAIIISLILVGMTFSISSAGYFSRSNVSNSEYKRISLGLAESCVNSALMKVSQNYNYMPAAVGDSVQVGAQDCLIKSVTYGPEVAGRKAAYISAQADYQGAFSNVKVSATVASTTYVNVSRATLYVIVHVINDSGGSKLASDVSLSVNPAFNPIPSGVFPGSESGTAVSVNIGTSDVSIPSLSGYTETHSSECVSGSLAVGQTKTCVVTYNDISNTATLTVVANVKNDNGGTKGPADFPLYIDGVLAVGGQAVTVSLGSHVVTGSSPSGYSASAWGYDCDSGGNVTLAAGNSKTCKINYDDIPPPAPTCADTMVMVDRTGSLSASDLASERAATKGLLDLYKKLPAASMPQVGIGRFGGASGATADVIGQLTINYGTDATSSAVGPYFPTGLGGIQQWTAPNAAFVNDAAFTTSAVNAKQQGFGYFGLNVPSGASISNIEVIVDGKSTSGSGGSATTPNLAPSAIGNYNAWTGSPTNTDPGKISALAANDASYITAAAVATSTFAVTNAIPAGSTINSVDFYVLALRTGSGSAANIKLIMEKGTTAGLWKADTGHALLTTLSTVSFTPTGISSTTNPVTGSTWASYGAGGLAELNAMRFGVIRTNATGQAPQVNQLVITVNYTPPPVTGSLGVSLSWNNGAASTTPQNVALSGTEAATTLGGTWGRTWVQSDFADGQFIVSLKNNSATGITASVNYITVKVSYNTPASGLYAAIDSGLITTSSGGTDINSGITIGQGEVSGVRHDSTKAKVLIILTDGLPTSPSNSQSYVMSAAAAATTTGTKIYLIHFGSGSGSDLAARISGSVNNAGSGSPPTQALVDAENGDGDNFFMTPSFDQLQAIFQQVGTAVCPAAGAAAVPPPTTGNVYVVTHVISDNGGVKVPSDFTMNVSGTNPSLLTFSGSDTPGVLVSLSPGAYTITESSLSGYSESGGIGCSGTIAGGDNITCTFTNDDNSPPPPPPPPPPPGIDIGPWVEASTTSPGP